MTAIRHRGPGRSICPSEVARDLAPDEASWRALMPAVRAAALRLQEQGKLRVTRNGVDVDATAAGGPIRLQLVHRPV